MVHAGVPDDYPRACVTQLPLELPESDQLLGARKYGHPKVGTDVLESCKSHLENTEQRGGPLQDGK